MAILLNLVKSQCVSYAAFGSSQISNDEHRNLYNVTLKGGGNAANLVVTDMPVICTPIFRPAVPQSVSNFLMSPQTRR